MNEKPKVVLIDDDAVTLKLLSLLLSNEGLQVHVAGNAAAGLAFELGANDYLTKPIDPAQFKEKVAALIK